MELDEGFGVAPDGVHVAGYLGSVLVLNKEQLQCLGLEQADVVGSGVFASIGWLCLVCEVFLDGCGKGNLY